MSDTSPPPAVNGAAAYLPQLQQLQAWQKEQQRFQAEVTSPPAERIATALASVVGRGSIQELQNSPNVLDQVMGRALPLAGAYVASQAGLSPATMVAGMNSIFEIGGTSLQSRGGYVPLAGVTAGGNQIAGRVFDLASRDLFHAGGAINLDRSYGASRDDVGNVYNELARRGVFAGDVAGTAVSMNAGMRSQMISQAMATGDIAGAKEIEAMADGSQIIQPNSALVSKIQSWRSQTLQSVQELRKVLGDLDVGSILAELERLTGVDIGQPGNLSSAMLDFRQRIARGQAAGLTPTQSLEFTAATASTLDAHLTGRMGLPQGALGDVAAGISGQIDRYALAAYRSGRSAGGYRELPEVATAMASDVSKIIADTPELTEAMFAASNMQKGSAAYNQLMSSIQAYGSAYDLDSRESAMMDMARTTERVYGSRSGSLVSLHGADNLLRHVQRTAPEVLGAGVDASLSSNQASMRYDFESILETQAGGAPYASALGGSARAAQFAQAMFQTFGGEDMKRMLAAGNAEAMAQIAGDTQLPGFGSAASAILAAQQHISRQSGGNVGMPDFMNYVAGQVQASPNMASMVGGGALGQLDRGAADIMTSNLAGKNMDQLSVVDDLEQKLLGGDVPLEDQALLRFGEANNDATMRTLLFNDKGGLSMDAGQAKEFAATMAGKYDLYSLLGVAKDDHAGLAAALADEGNMAIVGSALQDADILAGKGEFAGRDALIYSTDKDKLKKSYNDELARLRGEDPAAPSAAATPAPGAAGKGTYTVTFNITDSAGVTRTMQGTATINP